MSIWIKFHISIFNYIIKKALFVNIVVISGVCYDKTEHIFGGAVFYEYNGGNY